MVQLIIHLETRQREVFILIILENMHLQQVFIKYSSALVNF